MEQLLLAHELLLSDLALTAQALPRTGDPAQRAQKVALLKYLANTFTRFRMSPDHARHILVALREVAADMTRALPTGDPDGILAALDHTVLDLTQRLDQLPEPRPGETVDEECSTQ